MFFINLYILGNLILSLGAVLSFLLYRLQRLIVLNVASTQLLRIHLALISASIIVSAAVPILPTDTFSLPTPQIFDAVHAEIAAKTDKAIKAIPLPADRNSTVGMAKLFPILLCFILVSAFSRIALAIFRTRRFFARCFLYKSRGRVKLYLSDSDCVPFAFSLFRRSWIHLPIALLENPNAFKISFQHEAQHIRQRDTIWIYALEFLQSLCFWNPLVLAWIRTIEREQEFSCDERLILGLKVPIGEYGRCLYEVANLGMNRRKVPYGAVGFFYGDSRTEIIWRIEEMKKLKTKRKSSWIGASMLAFCVCVVVSFALALPSFALANRLSMSALNSVVRQEDFSSDFPITVNEEVLEQVNRFVRTEGGRRHVSRAMSNLQNYKSMITESIKKYNHPEELVAVGFVESAFRNLPPAGERRKSAGVWQFIETTARFYNLNVNDEEDQRQNVVLQTDAAMRYLGALNLRFQDWGLAILSYNAGEGRVQSGIDTIKSRDPWEIVRAGFDGDRGYLAKVIAAAIVMKYPSLMN